MASLSEAVLGAMPPTSTRPFQGPGTQAAGRMRAGGLLTLSRSPGLGYIPSWWWPWLGVETASPAEGRVGSSWRSVHSRRRRTRSCPSWAGAACRRRTQTMTGPRWRPITLPKHPEKHTFRTCQGTAVLQKVANVRVISNGDPAA